MKAFFIAFGIASAILLGSCADPLEKPPAQEAAEKFQRGIRGEGTLEAWVWRMVVNAALKESARPIHEELADIAAAGSAQDPTTVAEAVARLPEQQRLTLFLRYYADLDYRSIATALEVAPGTVAATLNAAHTTLRRLLQEVRP